MSIIAAGTTTTTALSSTGNTDGTLQFQVNGTTASVTLNTLGAIGVGSTPSYGTSGQILTSGGSTVAPAWTTPATPSPSVSATASGSISAGAPVILNSSGQATAITTTSVTSPTFTSTGLPGTIDTGCTTYDSKRNRFYVFWNSSTALNLSIYTLALGSSGTSVVLLSTSTVATANYVFVAGKVPLCAYNATTDKVAYIVQTSAFDSYLYVGACSDSGVSFANAVSASTYQDGYAAISVPGQTTILFATRKYPNAGVSIAVVETSTATPTISSVSVDTSTNWDGGSMTYDSTSTRVYLVMTTTSGTNTIFTLSNTGSLVVTTSGNPLGSANYARCAYSSTANKTVFTYAGGNAIIGTYNNGAGTWSFGSVVNFGSGTYTNPVVATDGRLLVYYSTSFKIGTISGTSVSFGTAITTGINVSTYNLFYSYSSGSNLTFNLAASVVYAGLTTTTLTNDNFLGFSSASYTNGQTATINTVGSVNTSQTSLTPASKYYVSLTAALTTANTGVYAGLATSATSILVKG